MHLRRHALRPLLNAHRSIFKMNGLHFPQKSLRAKFFRSLPFPAERIGYSAQQFLFRNRRIPAAVSSLPLLTLPAVPHLMINRSAVCRSSGKRSALIGRTAPRAEHLPIKKMRRRRLFVHAGNSVALARVQHGLGLFPCFSVDDSLVRIPPVIGLILCEIALRGKAWYDGRRAIIPVFGGLFE